MKATKSGPNSGSGIPSFSARYIVMKLSFSDLFVAAILPIPT